MSYTQDKLDEFDKQFSEEIILDQEVRMVVPGIKHFIEQSLTDYHNHIVDVLVDKIEEFANSHSDHDMKMAVMDTIDFIRPLQDTNPKE